MQLSFKIPPTLKGVLFIIAGCILLFDRFGLATEIIHTIVLLVGIGCIIVGLYLMQVHTIVYRFIVKQTHKTTPPSVDEENKFQS